MKFGDFDWGKWGLILIIIIGLTAALWTNAEQNRQKDACCAECCMQNMTANEFCEKYCNDYPNICAEKCGDVNGI